VRDRVRLFVESEMAHIENVDFGAGHVPPVCFGFIDQERPVKAAPQYGSRDWWRRSHSCHAG
jgi:hypothetical protein